MANFIIEEFKYYKVFLYGNKYQHPETDYGIQFRIDSGIALIKFCTGKLSDNHVEVKGDKKKFFCYFRSDQYYNFIDLMRYEKPLYFYYNFENNQTYITTEDEPVGEEEYDEDRIVNVINEHKD